MRSPSLGPRSPLLTLVLWRPPSQPVTDLVLGASLEASRSDAIPINAPAAAPATATRFIEPHTYQLAGGGGTESNARKVKVPTTPHPRGAATPPVATAKAVVATTVSRPTVAKTAVARPAVATATARVPNTTVAAVTVVAKPYAASNVEGKPVAVARAN